MTATPLPVALKQIAETFHLDAKTMYDAMLQDPHGGYHALYDDGFPTGSLWRVEGQFLYAFIRALKPANVLELGTWHGASATHILQALRDNDGGVIECIDNRAYGDVVIGDMIPKELKPFATMHAVSIEECLPMAVEREYTYDFIFEDAMHDAEQVAFVWSHADKLLNPGGVIISHDAMHAVAGFAVREGIARAGYKTTNVLIEPADCGFAIWRKGA
jgi:predicted O-methyltransferase YrrM